MKKKIGDVDENIPDVSGLVITTIEVDSKTPKLNGLVKKTDYDAKMSEMERLDYF